MTPGIAVVTGAGRRIGREIAIDLARHGWGVAVHHGHSAAEAERVCEDIAAFGGRCVAISADLMRADAAVELIAEAERALCTVTCLVNNASLFLEDSLGSLSAEQWDRQMAVNLRAPILLAKAFSERLRAPMVGNIVNLIDQRVLAPTPEFLSYSLSKAALYTATQMLAQALAPRIRVNGIGPGPVLPSVYQDEEGFAAEVKGTLLGRATPPAEIAAAVRFILDAPSLTGQMIALDAGQHLARHVGG